MKAGTSELLARIRNRFRARPGYWFVPKVFGWGVVPVNWQGWLATLLLVGAGVVIARFAEQRSDAWLALLVPLVAGFAWLAWRKTDGAWRWRWGE